MKAVLKMALALLPKAVTALTMTTKISEMIRPYSMAVAPESSRQKPGRKRALSLRIGSSCL